MKAQALYEKGDLGAAIQALEQELRDDPGDVRRRTFLFELLCFSGQRDRAEKQLDVISREGQQAERGCLLYRSALHADREREAMFKQGVPVSDSPPRVVKGTLNGHPFQSLEDGDPRIGARLELFVAGQYTWIPFEHVSSVRLEPPRRLRDLLWTPAHVKTGPGFEALTLGEVLLPVLSPLASESSDDAIRLGRTTDLVETPDGLAYPIGQKLFLVDGEPIPLLGVREIVIEGSVSEALP